MNPRQGHAQYHYQLLPYEYVCTNPNEIPYPPNILLTRTTTSARNNPDKRVTIASVPISGYIPSRTGRRAELMMGKEPCKPPAYLQTTQHNEPEKSAPRRDDLQTPREIPNLMPT